MDNPYDSGYESGDNENDYPAENEEILADQNETISIRDKTGLFKRLIEVFYNVLTICFFLCNVWCFILPAIYSVIFILSPKPSQYTVPCIAQA